MMIELPDVAAGDWLQSWILALAEAGVRGILLLAAVLLLALSLRRASAAVRHAVVAAGFLVMLFLPLAALLPWRLPVIPFQLSFLALDAPSPGEAELAVAIDAIEEEPSPSAAPPVPTVGEGAALTRVVVDPPVEVSPVAAAGSDLFLPMIVWFFGMLLIGARMAVSQWSVRGMVRRSTPVTDERWLARLWESADRLEIGSEVRLLCSKEVEIAFTTGVLRPAVVLPALAEKWGEARMRAVLMHELAHVRRRDLLLHHASRVASMFYWFNPFVWIAARRLRAESERAADDLVLATGTRASDYADHLLEILVGARGRAMPSPVLPFARKSEFEGRILAVLEEDRRRGRVGRGHAAVLLAAVLVLAIPVAALAPVDAEPTSELGMALQQLLGSRAQEAPEQLPGDVEEVVADIDDQQIHDWAVDGDWSIDQDLDVANAWSVDLEWLNGTTQSPSVSPSPSTSSLFSTRDESSLGQVAGQMFGGNDWRADEQTWAGVFGDEALAIVETLSELQQDPRAIAALIRLLRGDSIAEVRVAAAHALGDMEAEEAIDALALTLRQDRISDVRAAAAHALGQIESERGVEALVAAADDTSEEVRHTALEALSNIDEEHTAPFIARRLSDSSAAVRLEAIQIMTQLGLDRAPPELVRALADPNANVRAAVALALGEIEDPTTASALAAALGDTNPGVREAAIQALGRLETPASIDALIRALESPNAEVRRSAARALSEL